MAVTRDDVMRMALLSNLELPVGDIDRIVDDLTNILEHMDVLQNLDMAADAAGEKWPGMKLRVDEPTTPAGEMMQLVGARNDRNGEVLVRDGFFLVPRLDSHE